MFSESEMIRGSRLDEASAETPLWFAADLQSPFAFARVTSRIGSWL